MLSIETHVFNSFQVNTYLIKDEKDNCLVVDPAFYTSEEIAEFDRHIISSGLKIKGQINTHCHVDHVLGVLHIKRKYGCPLRAHPNEALLLKNAPLQGDMFGMQVEAIERIDEPLEDQDHIALGGHILTAILVPGHSPGSLAFYSPEAAFVITGDALFEGSIGRTDLPGGDYETLINSIQSRLLSLSPDTTVYPGHGASTTIANEAANNPFLTMV